MNFLTDKNKGLIQVGLVLLFVVAAFAISRQLQSEAPAETETQASQRTQIVETSRLSPQQHQIRIKTTGIVQASTNVNVVPQVTGQVVWIKEDFFEGGAFSADETLFKIDPRDYQFEVDRLQAEVARAQTALALENAESNAALDEWNVLNPGKKASDLVARVPQVAEAEANLKAATAQLNRASLELSRTEIRMPFDGRVLSSSIALGSFVTAGQQVALVFDTHALEVHSSLNDNQLAWMNNQQANGIDIAISHLGKTQRYAGHLKRSASSLEPNTRFANMIFGLAAQTPVSHESGQQHAIPSSEATAVMPGMFAEITIKGKTLKNVVLLPSQSVVDGSAVWTVDNQSTLQLVPFKRLYTSDDYIAVTGISNDIEAIVGRLDGAIQNTRVDTVSPQNTALSSVNTNTARPTTTTNEIGSEVQ